MAQVKRRLVGPELRTFLDRLGIVRIDPVGPVPQLDVGFDDQTLDILLRTGEPITPGPGRLDESPEVIQRLFVQAGPDAAFPLTPDGHLASHEPLLFDPDRAATQLLEIADLDLAEDKR